METKKFATPHQGEALKQIINNTPYSIVDVANMLEVTRRAIYKYFEQPILKRKVIESIGNAINVDMYATMPSVFGSGEQIRPIKGKTKSKDLPSSMEEYWKAKYLIAVTEIDTLKADIHQITEKAARKAANND